MAGFGNCDGDLRSNGCEVNLTSSVSHCGACGNTCSSVNGTPSCVSGACQISCNAGYGNCDGNVNNGCEANFNTSNSHCGSCGHVCPGGTTCSAGNCVPLNDNRAGAISVSLHENEATVTGTTLNATLDGPSGLCGCTIGGNVWYTFTLPYPSVVYLDTAGSGLDTSLLLTDSAGNALPSQPGNGQSNAGLCNDDGGCGISGGFSSAYESRTWGFLNSGNYYVAVGGCFAGAFTLHIQRMPMNVASYFYTTRITGNSSSSTTLVGASMISSGACGGMASGEDARWFIACGTEPNFFSICPGDGGTWTRQIGGTMYDPDIYILSAQTGAEVICNDDSNAVNCSGTGGDAFQYGSRLSGTVAPRGLNAIFVDERTGGSGMQYTLVYTTP